jgi:hypothetical protein
VNRNSKFQGESVELLSAHIRRGKRDIKEGTYELRRLENVLTTGVITLEVRSFLGWILVGKLVYSFCLGGVEFLRGCVSCEEGKRGEDVLYGNLGSDEFGAPLSSACPASS